MLAPYRNHAGRCAGLLLALVMISFLAAGCGTAPPPRRFDPAPGLRQRGKASYYSNSLAGRPTASGEPYRPSGLTAAHRVLPLGTRVRVIRLDPGGHPSALSVVVRVNDRGPYARGRIIDLSLAAARQLRMLGAGVIPVELEVLEVPARRR